MTRCPLSIVVLAVFALLAGCAGPASPLGAIHSLSPQKAQLKPRELASISSASLERVIPPQIEFHPARQVLHGASPLKIRIRDALGITPTYRVRIFHNGYDVSDAFHAQVKTQILPGAHEMELTVPDVRFLATEDNEVEVYYFREDRQSAATRAVLASPDCRPFARDRVASTGGFRVSERLLRMIERHSLQHGYNPGYVTGLVAQESGFNNSSVSWAKAMGITQVTPIAEASVISSFPDFPRYPGLNEKTYPEIKALILLGKVNGSNEWRLDDELSVKGGLTYLDSVRRFWYAPENFAIVQNSFTDTESGIAKVILASYHSGPTRVKRALLSHGANWLREEDSLYEAKKYVNRIFSFCYHFSEQPEVRKNEKPAKVAAAP